MLCLEDEPRCCFSVSSLCDSVVFCTAHLFANSTPYKTAVFLNEDFIFLISRVIVDFVSWFYWCIWRHLTEVLFLPQLLYNFQHCNQWFTVYTAFHCRRLFGNDSKPSSAASVWHWWARLQVLVLGGAVNRSTMLGNVSGTGQTMKDLIFKPLHSSFFVLGVSPSRAHLHWQQLLCWEKKQTKTKSPLIYGRTTEITVVKGCLLHLSLWVDWSSSGVTWVPCVCYAWKWLEVSHAFSGKSSELEPKILSCGKCCHSYKAFLRNQEIPPASSDWIFFLLWKKNPKYLIRASALEIWSELGRGYMQDNLSWFTLFSWYIAGVGAITLWNMSLYACSPNEGNAVKVLKICLQMGNDGLLLAPTLTCGQLCVLWQPWYH